MGTTSSTPGAALSASSAERFPPDPTAATMARSDPRVTCGVNPHSLIRSITCCSSASVELLAMLMTIGFSCYCDFLFAFHAPRLANDTAKNAQNTFCFQRTSVLLANALQYLAFTTSVVDRQAARLLDPADFGSDRPLVQQAQQLGVERIDGATPLQQRFCVEFMMAVHVSLPKRQKPRLGDPRL